LRDIAVLNQRDADLGLAFGEGDDCAVGSHH
jgi:hypothetical protein